MQSAVDTIWNAFKTRLAFINPQRKAVAYMDAMDWPPQIVQFNSFYLLELASNPLNKASWSAAVPIYDHLLQFVWIVQGTDVNNYNDKLGRNRGDRVRINGQMKEEIVQALYPGFAQKQFLTVNASDQLEFETLNEPVIWSQPQFRTVANREAGTLYCMATVHLTDMSERCVDNPPLIISGNLKGLNPSNNWVGTVLDGNSELEVTNTGQRVVSGVNVTLSVGLEAQDSFGNWLPLHVNSLGQLEII